MTAKQQARKAVHALADISKPAGKIRFIHFRDGKEHVYYSAVNDMTGSRLSAFDNDPPTIDNTVAEVKKVFKAIREKATKVIEVVGDF